MREDNANVLNSNFNNLNNSQKSNKSNSSALGQQASHILNHNHANVSHLNQLLSRHTDTQNLLNGINTTTLNNNSIDSLNSYNTIDSSNLTINNNNLEFYQLHYPPKKNHKPQSPRKINVSLSNHRGQMRSKSVASTLTPIEQNHQIYNHNFDLPNKFHTKNSLRDRHIAHRHNNSVHQSHQDISNPEHLVKAGIQSPDFNKRQNPKSGYFKHHKQQPSYKPTLTLKKALAAQYQAPINEQQLSLYQSLKDGRDLQEWTRKSISVKLTAQKMKDEKIKANRIILSQKQSDQIKMEYLKSKREQIEYERNLQIQAIYDEFFKKQYEANYGGKSRQIFKDTILELVNKFTFKTFQKQ